MHCAILSFFFNDTATTENYPDGHTLSLHDALPISARPELVIEESEIEAGIVRDERAVGDEFEQILAQVRKGRLVREEGVAEAMDRSEEHTSELQSLMRISYAVFCLKKKQTNTKQNYTYT